MLHAITSPNNIRDSNADRIKVNILFRIFIYDSPFYILVLHRLFQAESKLFIHSSSPFQDWETVPFPALPSIPDENRGYRLFTLSQYHRDLGQTALESHFTTIWI